MEMENILTKMKAKWKWKVEILMKWKWINQWINLEIEIIKNKWAI